MSHSSMDELLGLDFPSMLNMLAGVVSGRKHQVYECRVYDANGKLKEVISEDNVRKIVRDRQDAEWTPRTLEEEKRLNERRGHDPSRTVRRKQDLPERGCKGCGKEFKPDVKLQVYCTGKCRRTLEPLRATCFICKKTFLTVRHNARYCGSDCKRLGKIAYSKEWKKKRQTTII